MLFQEKKLGNKHTFFLSNLSTAQRGVGIFFGLPFPLRGELVADFVETGSSSMDGIIAEAEATPTSVAKKNEQGAEKDSVTDKRMDDD